MAPVFMGPLILNFNMGYNGRIPFFVNASENIWDKYPTDIAKIILELVEMYHKERRKGITSEWNSNLWENNVLIIREKGGNSLEILEFKWSISGRDAEAADTKLNNNTVSQLNILQI